MNFTEEIMKFEVFLSMYVTWDFAHSHYFGVKLRKTNIFTIILCGIEVFSILPPHRVNLSLFTF